MGKPIRSNVLILILEFIEYKGQPREVNHLSTSRKRKQKCDSVSSGERTRKSLNFLHVSLYALCRKGYRV